MKVSRTKTRSKNRNEGNNEGISIELRMSDRRRGCERGNKGARTEWMRA